MSSHISLFNVLAANQQKQIGYLLCRITESIANAVDKIRPFGARYALTNAMVKHSRVLLGQERGRYEIVPLPVTEAISNQLFILSLNDPKIFVHLLLGFYSNSVPGVNILSIALPENDPVNFGDADPTCYQVMGDLRDLELCASQLELVAEEKNRFTVQQYLLSESIQLLAHEHCGSN